MTTFSLNIDCQECGFPVSNAKLNSTGRILCETCTNKTRCTQCGTIWDLNVLEAYDGVVLLCDVCQASKKKSVDDFVNRLQGMIDQCN